MDLVGAMWRRLSEGSVKRYFEAFDGIVYGQDGPRVWSSARPSFARGDSQLCDVVPVTAANVWVVGNQDGHRHPLAAHWNGHDWLETSVPGDGGLSKVTASASDDVWAICWNDDDDSVVHWDGIAWSGHPVAPTTGELNLYDIVSFGGDDVWVVGATSCSGDGTAGSSPVLQHWDGVTWSLVTLPATENDFGTLFALERSGPADLWAIGITGGVSLQQGREPYYVHFDGQDWERIQPPIGFDAFAESIAVLTTGEVVLVGNPTGTFPRSSASSLPLCHRWDGGEWHELTVPSDLRDAVIYQTASDGTGGFWLSAHSADRQVIFLHWCEGEWKVVSAPETLGYRIGFIQGLANVPGSADMWGVGSAVHGSIDSLVMRYTGAETVCQVTRGDL